LTQSNLVPALGDPGSTEPYLPPHEYAEACKTAQRLIVLISTTIPLKATKLCDELSLFIDECVSPALVDKLRKLQQIVSDISVDWSKGQPHLPNMCATTAGCLTPLSDLPGDAELSPSFLVCGGPGTMRSARYRSTSPPPTQMKFPLVTHLQGDG
jgi:hypothetical protein